MEAEIQTVHKESDEELRRVYGEDAVFSRVGKFTLVHLDSPTEEAIAKRTSEFDPDEFFFDECVLCAQAKAAGGHVVFDSSADEDDSSEAYAEEADEAETA
ncbi:MAG: hypothetical protein M3Y34_00075 [Actinomycetota bacterium]|jgi:hypothetical protein|nr:hypothetical protein [Actinomycetota bacterium]